MRTWLRLLATSIALSSIAVSCGGTPSLHEDGESVRVHSFRYFRIKIDLDVLIEILIGIGDTHS